VYKLDSFVGFIGDEQLHAQECYEATWFFFGCKSIKINSKERQPGFLITCRALSRSYCAHHQT
jgi:hypothetical protein